MNKKNQVLMTVLGVFALVIVTVGVSYAFFTYTRTSSTTSTITTTTEAIEFGFTDGGNVTLTEAVALTEEQGAKVNPYVININAKMPTNSRVTYTIYAVNNTDEVKTGEQKALTNAQVRALLTKTDGTVLDGWSTTQTDPDTQTQTTVAASKLMSAVITSGNEGVLHTYTVDTTGQTTIADSYNLRIWLASDAAGGAIDATDNGTGTIVESDDGSYTTDGETVTSTSQNSVYSLKIRVEATADPIQQ